MESHTTDVELAWAAGFFDGEGTFNSSLTAFSCSVANTHKPNIERFLAAVGGIGNIGATPKACKNKLLYVYRAYGAKGHEVAKRLAPHLSTEKRVQLLRALVRFVNRPLKKPERAKTVIFHREYEPAVLRT